MKILIADDDKLLVQKLAAKLSERGFEIFAAYDAIQAWMAVMRYVPDAVVLDVSMPAGTGIEVLRKLKQFPKTSAIPAVVIGGVAEHSLAEKAKTFGADAFLVKPFSAEQLLQQPGAGHRTGGAPGEAGASKRSVMRLSQFLWLMTMPLPGGLWSRCLPSGDTLSAPSAEDSRLGRFCKAKAPLNLPSSIG